MRHIVPICSSIIVVENILRKFDFIPEMIALKTHFGQVQKPKQDPGYREKRWSGRSLGAISHGTIVPKALRRKNRAGTSF